MFKNAIGKVSSFLNTKLVKPVLNISKNISDTVLNNKTKVRNILLAGTIGIGSSAFAADNTSKIPSFDSTQEVSKSTSKLKFANENIDLSKIQIDNLNKVSIVDLFKQLKIKSSYENRKKVFNHFFEGEKYVGSYNQNVTFIKKTKEYIIEGNTGVELKEVLKIKDEPILEEVTPILVDTKIDNNDSNIIEADTSIDSNTLTLEDRFKKSIAFKKYNKLRKTNPENAERFKSETMALLEKKWGKDIVILDNNSSNIVDDNISLENNSTINELPSIETKIEDDTTKMNINPNQNGLEAALTSTSTNYYSSLGIKQSVGDETSTSLNGDYAQLINSGLGFKLSGEISDSSSKLIGSIIKGVPNGQIKLSLSNLKKEYTTTFSESSSKYTADLQTTAIGVEYGTNVDNIISYINDIKFYAGYFVTDNYDFGVINKSTIETSTTIDEYTTWAGIKGSKTLETGLSINARVNDYTSLKYSIGNEKIDYNDLYTKGESKNSLYNDLILNIRPDWKNDISLGYNSNNDGERYLVGYKYKFTEKFSTSLSYVKNKFKNGLESTSNAFLGLNYRFGATSKNDTKIINNEALFPRYNESGNINLGHLNHIDGINISEIKNPLKDSITKNTYHLDKDLSPDNFDFTNLTGVNLDTWINSNTITISGLNYATTISVLAGSEYSINGGTFTSTTGVINNGDTLTLRVKSSSSYNTSVTGGVNIGDKSDTFDVETKLGAITNFSTTNNTVDYDNTITFNWDSVSNVDNIEISIDGGTTWVSLASNSTTYTTGVLADGTYDPVVRSVKNGVYSPNTTISTLTINTVTPTSGTFVLVPDTKDTLYATRQVILDEKIINGNITSITFMNGSTLGGYIINSNGDLDLTNLHTHNNIPNGERMTINGTTEAGKPFSIDIDFPLL